MSQLLGRSLAIRLHRMTHLQYTRGIAQPCSVPAMLSVRRTSVTSRNKPAPPISAHKRPSDGHRRRQQPRGDPRDSNTGREPGGDPFDDDGIDLDVVLNDKQALGALKSHVLGQMASTQGSTSRSRDADEPSTIGRNGGRGPFDSDDYDYANVLGSDSPGIGGSGDSSRRRRGRGAAGSPDVISGSEDLAQEAAQKLAADVVMASHSFSSTTKMASAAVQADVLDNSRAGGAGASSPETLNRKQRRLALQPAEEQERQRQQQQEQQQPQRRQQQQQQRPQQRQQQQGRPRTPDGKPQRASSSSGRPAYTEGRTVLSSKPPRLSGDTSIGRVAESLPAGFAVCVLRQDKAYFVEQGRPMVYGGSVDRVIGRPPPVAGDAVVVTDAALRPLAWGVYNPNSMFCVRVFQHESEARQDDDSCILDVPRLIDHRVAQAASLRRTLGLPSKATTVYRLINSEGDRLSGVTADVLGSCVVVQSCAAWSERYRADITAAIQRHAPGGATEVIWRPSAGILLEEGIVVQQDEQAYASQSQDSEEEEGEVQRSVDATSLTSSLSALSAAADATADAGAPADIASASRTGLTSAVGGTAETSTSGDAETAAARTGQASTSGTDSASDARTVEVREAGVRFLASPHGQKTGFYADQRHQRAFIASVSKGATVLDLCCYSGAFALLAAAAGAAAVTGVDSSGPAIELATSNAALNGLSGKCCFVEEEIQKFLRAAVEEGQAWDVVVLDPPKLAPRKSTLERASGKYRRLNSAALAVVKPGGLFMTCSCSGAMTQSGEFMNVVMEAAQHAKRQLTLLRKSGAGPDHVLDPAYPEGQYLTALAFRVM